MEKGKEEEGEGRRGDRKRNTKEYKGKQTATDLVVLARLFVGNYTNATTSSMSKR